MRRSISACKALLDALNEQSQGLSIKITPGEERRIVLSQLRRLAQRYAQTLCFYLDATVEFDIVKQILGNPYGMPRGIDFWECSVAYSPSVQVYQDTSCSWGMTSLCPKNNGERQVEETLLRVAWDEIVRRSVLTKTKFAVISYQAVHNYIQSGATPPGSKSLKDSPYFCGSGYFGNIRGKDCFNKKGVRHLYIIGRARISSEKLHDKARAIFSKDQTPLSFQSDEKKTPSPAGIVEETVYVDERVQAVYRMFNTAETAQAAHRLRLIHGDEPKELFLLTHEKLPLRVNHKLQIKTTISEKARKILELRQALCDQECVIRTKKQWKVWPTCLNGLKERTFRELLEKAEEDVAVCTYLSFNYTTADIYRTKRNGLVIGANRNICRAALKKLFPEDKIEHFSRTA